MAFGLSKQRMSPIAVDFGADSLKLLQLVPEHPAQLVAAAAAVVPGAVRQDPAARSEFYTRTLKKLLKGQGFKGKRVMLGIPAHQTLMQNLEVTVQEGVDPSPQVEAHLRDRLGLEPSRMVVRHFDVGPVHGEGGAQREVVAIAAPRDAVIGYLNAARACKLDVIGMHSSPQAILRAFSHMYQRSDDAERVVAFLDIGAATTTLVIAHGLKMVFAKNIQCAGDQMTQQYAKSQRLDFAEARSARIGLSGGGTQTAAAVAEVELSDDDPRRHHQHAIDILIDEVQLCLRYYQRRFPTQPIEKLVFLGGEARHTDVCQKIARTLRIAAQLGDPFAALMRMGRAKAPVGVDLNQPQPGWAVPYGLCWSEANL